MSDDLTDKIATEVWEKLHGQMHNWYESEITKLRLKTLDLQATIDEMQDDKDKWNKTKWTLEQQRDDAMDALNRLVHNLGNNR